MNAGRIRGDAASEDILGYPVFSGGRARAVERAIALTLAPGGPRYFVCANPHSLETARTDAEFDLAIREADLVVPDGIGIVIASRLLGGGIRERVTGMDVFLGLLTHLNRAGGSCYLLGSSDAVLGGMGRRMAAEFPAVRVTGTNSPPYRREFSREEEREMLERINATRPDVLWVGMTAPKQEKWIRRNRGNLDARFVGAVGAVFDFYAGTVRRSPPLFRDHGLEWLPRLLREPRRLWRRNLVSNPRFLARVIGARLRGGAAR